MNLVPKQNFFEGEFAPKDFEERILQFWEENKIFEESLRLADERGSLRGSAPKDFTFYDGPPFATGLPHYGHILASTVKDLVGRYQTMRGRYVRRRWGWDCHGLPIEEIVERKLKISGKRQIEELGIKQFNETCRSMVLQFADEWKKTIRRIARWVEFDNSYKTMDASYMESVWWGFKKIFEKGLVYEGRKVLLYCPRCETPVSNFEIAMDNSYKDVTDTAVTVKFRIENKELRIKDGVLKLDAPTYLLAWTTTPWTLPANVALAVGKDIVYGVVEKDNETLIVAENSPLGREIGIIERKMRGTDLIGLEYEPLFDVPEMKSDGSYHVYGGDFVTTEDGTGIVHISATYGEDDYALAVREQLPIVPLLDEKGKFNEKAPEPLRGMYFKDADKLVVEDLASRQLLFASDPSYSHSYPHCWRCGNPLFYNAIPSWFINIQNIKQGLLDTNEKEMYWYPAHLKHGRYAKSVEQAPDWNISRNRYWGNPIPVWRCHGREARNVERETHIGCGNIFVAGSVEELKKKSVARNTYFFSRHGESDNVIMGITGPHKDTPLLTAHLTKKGIEQIEQLAASLAREHIDMIISSPLARTKETAEIFSRVTGAPVSYRDDLVDLNPGIFYRKPTGEAEEFMKGKNRFITPFPEGESQLDVRRRLLKAFREIDQEHVGKKILLVSHADPLRVLKSALEGMPRDADMPYVELGELYSIDTKPIPLNDDGDLDLHRPYIDEIFLACSVCGGEMRRTTEVFDSWVEAGSMPFSELHYPFLNQSLFETRFPAQFVAEYIAQTRAWFYVMHVLSYVIFDKAPVQHLVTTGTILAEDGSKMSKSKGNFPDPWKLLDTYGSDALRFYLMNSVVMQADNLNFSEREVGNVYRKMVLIWKNVLNYYETYRRNEKGEMRKEVIEQQSSNVLDRWILVRTQELVNTVTEGLDGYDTVRATRAMMEYVDDLSTWYVRRSRGRTDVAFFETLRHALLISARVIAPVMPYMAEAVYGGIMNNELRIKENTEDKTIIRNSQFAIHESVHLAEWPLVYEDEQEKVREGKEIIDAMAEVRRIASVGQALRKENNIPLRQPIASLKIKDTALKLKISDQFLDVLRAEVNAKTILFDPNIKNEIELDTELTPELQREGLVRGLERAVQDLRKRHGFKVGEQAYLVYDTHDTEVLAALQNFNKEKTYIFEMAAGSASEALEIDGRKLFLGLKKQ